MEDNQDRAISRRTTLLGAGVAGGLLGAWVLGIGPLDQQARARQTRDETVTTDTETQTRTDSPTSNEPADENPVATETPTPTRTPSPTPSNPTFEFRGRPIVIVKNVFGRQLVVKRFIGNLSDGVLEMNIDVKNVGEEPIINLVVEAISINDDGEPLDRGTARPLEIKAGSEKRLNIFIPWSVSVAGIRVRFVRK